MSGEGCLLTQPYHNKSIVIWMGKDYYVEEHTGDHGINRKVIITMWVLWYSESSRSQLTTNSDEEFIEKQKCLKY